MKTVNRKDIKEPAYRKIFDVETHHNHEIIEDKQGTLRWKENPDVNTILSFERAGSTTKNMDKINLNSLIMLFRCLGYDKNSEVYRKLYRDMGYSLFGYWEVFYWEVNNEDADDYSPPSPAKIKAIPKVISKVPKVKSRTTTKVIRRKGKMYVITKKK